MHDLFLNVSTIMFITKFSISCFCDEMGLKDHFRNGLSLLGMQELLEESVQEVSELRMVVLSVIIYAIVAFFIFIALMIVLGD